MILDCSDSYQANKIRQQVTPKPILQGTGLQRFIKYVLLHRHKDSPVCVSLQEAEPTVYNWMEDFQMLIIGVVLRHKSRTTLGEPGWSEALHWLISFTPVLCIPAWFCYYTCPRGVWRVTRVFSAADADGRYQTPSTGLRHHSFKEEGAGKRCSECVSLC